MPSSPSTLDWRVAPHQDRSHRTEAALGRATAELLRDRSFETITVAEIARHAGVAVGTVYRRFRDKRALLHLTDTAFLDECRQAFDEAMSDQRVRGMSLQDLAHTYIDVMVRKFREHRAAIVQVQRNADIRDGRVYAERAAAFNAHVHGRFRVLLRRHFAEVSHRDPEAALNLAIFFASAAARDAVWRNALRAYPVAVDDTTLVVELTRAFVGYLRGSE